MSSFTDGAHSSRQAVVDSVSWVEAWDAENSGAPPVMALDLDDGTRQPLTDTQHIAMIQGAGDDYRQWPGALVEVGTEPTDNPEIPYRRFLTVLEVM
ncbi:hypothetical protein [Candidatus Poriferisodalis sp.]|uniref:hypothetical protein n=1 Tax=Candidatus Poriferisodalis sp. TaxID=3101277 RepID=UPI003B016BBA